MALGATKHVVWTNTRLHDSNVVGVDGWFGTLKDYWIGMKSKERRVANQSGRQNSSCKDEDSRRQRRDVSVAQGVRSSGACDPSWAWVGKLAPNALALKLLLVIRC